MEEIVDMKKLLILATVMVAMFGFSTGAFAAWGDPICEPCKGCYLGQIPCDIDTWQGHTQGDNCDSFEWDTTSLLGGTTRNGYCETILADQNDYPCRLIFNICNCEDPNLFESDATIGVRMSVMVDGVIGHLGAYFTDPVPTILLGLFADTQKPCDDTPQVTDDFGTITFYWADRKTVVDTGDMLGLAPIVCDPIEKPSQAVVLVSDDGQGYTITEDDEDNGRHFWWIDIPAIRIDRNILHDGEIISVKVELLSEGTGGICAECESVCECIVDVAEVCCDTLIPLPDQFGMYFPYVTWQGAWSTGIVVTNISSMVPYAPMVVAPEDMEVTFVLHDVNGDQFTYFKDDFTTANWAFSMGALVPEFDGTPADGPAWLEVQTNFVVDGYSYIANGNFGLGTLPRQWSSIIELAKQYLDYFGVTIDELVTGTIFNGK